MTAVAEGRAHAEALLPVVTALFAEPSPAVIKAVLHAEGRIPAPDVRMPLASASPRRPSERSRRLSAPARPHRPEAHPTSIVSPMPRILAGTLRAAASAANRSAAPRTGS